MNLETCVRCGAEEGDASFLTDTYAVVCFEQVGENQSQHLLCPQCTIELKDFLKL